MAYDEARAERVRELLADEAELSERRMFGGLAFMVGGNLAVAVSGQGGLLVRIDPDERERLLRADAVDPMVMRGREMAGWIRVADEGLRTSRQLARWVERGAAVARALPPKPPAKRGR